ncbi:MAG: ribonuclease domain-containing protein [Chloroflexota bacterium]|nr:ribonuclease domain-containing protein [Chloroflexota bacterium]
MESTSEPSPQPSPTPAPTATVARASDLPVIAYADLPPEAHDTIALIDAGGPFPFSKDGSTFQNREGILPDKPRGYYGEYTVITPGSADRGARRIVAGEGGEMYYTDDHYASFREVMR